MATSLDRDLLIVRSGGDAAKFALAFILKVAEIGVECWTLVLKEWYHAIDHIRHRV